MRHRHLFVILLMLLNAFAVIAQVGERGSCHYYRNRDAGLRLPLTAAQRDLIDETIARSDTFDIRHYEISLDVTDYGGQYLKASTTITYAARMDGQSSIRFDLQGLQVDSVTDGDGALPYTYDGQFLRVDLGTAPAIDEERQLMVHYQGTPDRDPNWGGFYFESNYIYNLGIGLTTVPPNFGKVWYPCFDSFVERASYSWHVKSAGGRRFHGQGEFLGETPLGGDTVIRSYMLTQEIPTHISAVAVADYAEHNYVHTGANGDIPVTLLAKSATLPSMVSKFTDLSAAIDALEYWYGPYAYGRVGYVLTTDGALEIPTNVAYPDFMPGQSASQNRKLFTHELGHHWWGDVVTPHIHNDMWLKEGPAEYSAHLLEEWLYGRAAMVAMVKNNLLDIMNTAHLDDGGFQPLSPMPDEHIYGTHTYYKGAAVLHNLRGYLGDEAFRNAMRQVQLQYGNSDLTAAQFRDALEAVSGEDLHPFFQDWIFSPGYSVFEVRSFTAAPGGGAWEVDLRIGQKLYGTLGMHTDVPLDLTLFAADGNVHEQRIMAGGVLTELQVSCPFEPVLAVLNRYQRLNQARMDHEITLVPGVSFGNVLPYVDFRLYANTLVDSTLVRVDHIWSGADTDALGWGITQISDTHYWNVDGLWPEGTSLRGRLLYMGGVPNQMDHALIAGDETGLVVVHRRTADEPWQVYADQTINAGSLTNGTGTITMETLEKGQYAYAKMSGAIGVPEQQHAAFALYPVPADDQLTVRLDAPAEGTCLVDAIAADGRVVLRRTAPKGSTLLQLDVSSLAEGAYTIRVVSMSGTVLGARAFFVAR
ncbi:MAG: M1 family metallopeptidase [Flavobacteriales bacterium]|nr:M1 family metallopeptidase [Flavobacteriales bacterium]